MTKKILLIGGSGYIGSVLSRSLLKNNHKVYNIDSLIYDNYFANIDILKHKNYFFKKLCVSNSEINENFINNFDSVVLLSGLVGDPITKKYPKIGKSYNEIFIKQFIEKCTKSKIKKLIFVSTCSNYGIIKDNEFADENHYLNPQSLYAKSKIEIEQFLISLKKTNTFQTTILRFATAFGLSPRMRFDLTISHFAKDAYYNKKLEIFDKNTWRPYCHVNDFSILINLIITNNYNYNFEIFNAGSNENNYSKKIIVEKLIEKMPGLEVIYKEGDVDPRNYRVNFNKLNSIIGFNPLYNLNFGLNEIIKSFDSKLFDFNIKNKNQFGNYNLDHIN